MSLQYRERIIFVGKPVDDEMGNQLVATMLYLDSENQQDMTFYINCAGGEVMRVIFCHKWKHGSIRHLHLLEEQF